MARQFWGWLIFACLASLPLPCQTSSKPQLATITAVALHQEDGEDQRSNLIQYEVSLKVGNRQYVTLYTPPSGSRGVEYAVGQDLLVLVGTNSITFTKLGKTSEVPILRTEDLAAPPGPDWSRAPSEYFSQKLRNLSAKLDLTAEQQAKMKPIFEQEAGEAGQITANPVLSTEQKLEKLGKIVRSSDQKLKPILSADQWQGLQNMRKEQQRELKQMMKGETQ